MGKRESISLVSPGESGPQPVSDRHHEIFSGGGELGARILAFDWSKTPLGPISTWPQSLITTVRILITSRYAMWMGWGEDMTFLYNDAYAHMSLGKKHPWALGKRSNQVWAEIWKEIGPRIQSVLTTGEATWDEALMLFLERSDYTEETYHTFSYSPLTDDQGQIVGHFCVVTEETERIINERRLASLRTLAGELSGTATEKDVLAAIRNTLLANQKDLPFTLTYLFENETQLRLACATGIHSGHAAAPESIDLNASTLPWPLRDLAGRKGSVVVENLGARFGAVPTGAWDKSPTRALLVPITRQGQESPAGVIVAALNPFRPLDAGYTGFIDLLAGQIGAGIANARAYQEERKRAEALAELDRAKTTFFSNISHEFRTPLTLMLGPTEDALAGPQQALRGADLETVHRNELRLLKLVNTLLDFSRLEAGRVKASYRPTDLAAYTSELASVFRSAIEKAGLTYIVESAHLPHQVYIDQEMWEKIVLNLISNALKSTFNGSVAVRLTDRGDHAELVVRDTGTGIAENEIPHLFERFRRIENARRRTHEGSGIGLALVHELVNMHGGTIEVQSRLGKGTAFTVSLPYGHTHLPEERIVLGGPAGVRGMAREVFVQEALSWLPSQSNSGNGQLQYSDLTDIESAPVLAEPSSAEKATVLLVDDNRDMLEYVERLLSSRFRVITAENGRRAFEKARAGKPDLVLSDVMMPEMDGYQLLAALRQDPATSSVPVILLSARAGEDSRIEGMRSGADDYLVKPFTARELLARVDAHINIARFRRQALEREAQLEHELQDAQRRAAEALDHISDFFITVDSEWKCTYLNEAAQKVLGVSADELLGQSVWDRFPALHGTELETQYRRSMELRVPVEFEHISPTTHRFFRIRLFPAPDDGMVISATEITERRRTEQQLRLKQEHLLLTQKAAKIGSWELDLEAEELSISVEFAEIIGLPSYVSRLRYTDFLNSLFVSSDREAAQAALKKAIHGGKDFAVELRLRRPDGSVRIVSNRGKVFYNQGTPMVLGVLVDITPTRTKELQPQRRPRKKAHAIRK
ncbi:MAG TPA: ATP-binding protein [Candidatus Angelobacter sp.]|jgi:PAS domain S-box-containing protein